ncbi:MAG: YihA family ribosome biogenesis GTP-binding protein [Ruminococcus sp.]|nr:YihA family ribosome biogenesis GTP-binding protein [Ruminococcus sp.]
MNFQKAEFVTSFGRLSQMPPSDRIEIAFSGRSNVGKSSLINKIFGRKALARVSSVPGKTVTINFFKVENVHFVDLPGYGYAKVSKREKQKWGELIGGYLNDGERRLELVFQLIDSRHAPSREDVIMLNFLIDNEIPFVIVFTKADKLKPSKRAERMEAFAQEIPCFEDITSIVASIETGEGIDEIREIIEEIAEGEEITPLPPDANDKYYVSDDLFDDVDDGFEGGYLRPFNK